jgi:hypothetical protein
LEQQLEPLHAVKGCAVFFVVKFKWFEEAQNGNAALVMDNVAHSSAKVKRVRYFVRADWQIWDFVMFRAVGRWLREPYFCDENALVAVKGNAAQYFALNFLF